LLRVPWTEIDRQTNNNDFNRWATASFAFSKPGECRFVRLTQTGKTDDGNDQLVIESVEFFGTLIE
jgi:hypothetical protein